MQGAPDPNAITTCNCAVHVEHDGGVLRIDHCGIETSVASLSFYYDEEESFGNLVSCDTHNVSYANIYNNKWWEVKDNAANIHNRFLCAKVLDNEDNYIVSACES